VLGASLDEIEVAREALRAMLKANGPAPEGRFSELAVLEAVKDYPARHASTMLAFEAAAEAVRQAVQAQTQAGTSRTSRAGAA
jgi:NifU-like protein involved in Fe-S cluster formation